MGGAYHAPYRYARAMVFENTSCFIKTATDQVVLVTLGERKRPVTFLSSADPSKEKEPLLNDVFFLRCFKRRRKWCFQ